MLLAALLIAAAPGAARTALLPWQVGDSVTLDANGPVVSATQLSPDNSVALIRDINLGREEGAAGGYAKSSSGLYAIASAHKGVVGAGSFLDWINPIDYWSGKATASTADIVRVSNPDKANQTVSVLLEADISGGLGIAGPAARAGATAQLYFAGNTGLRPYQGDDSAYYTGGFALMFRDDARQENVGYDSDTNEHLYQSVYDYGTRYSSWVIDLLLDSNGLGEFWVLLELEVSTSEDGQCKKQCGHFGSPSEVGAAASDYRHTVRAYFVPLDSGTSVASTAGWAPLGQPQPPGAVSEPPALAVMLTSLVLLVAARRGRRRKYSQ